MNNRINLKQERKRITALVNESPTVAVIFRKATVSDGYEDQVENPFGTPTEHTVRLRIAHDSRQMSESKTANGQTFANNLNRLATWEFDTVIYEGDIFSALGKQFIVGPVDTLMKFGGIVGYQAPLHEGETI